MHQCHAALRRLKFEVRYDGTDFHGWQIQPGQRTVQGVIEDALSQIAQQRIRITGAGRTDSGVHALAQVFHCDWPIAAEFARLPKALSRMLGPEVSVGSVLECGDDFHARYSAKSKRYGYTLHRANTADPFSARYAWRVDPSVDREALAHLARFVEGKHDFAGFQCSGDSVETTVPTIYGIAIEDGPLAGPAGATDHVRLVFHGNGFLYKMVRNIVAVLVDAARGHLPDSIVHEKLAETGPYQGMTAPAHGLFLMNVLYE